MESLCRYWRYREFHTDEWIAILLFWSSGLIFLHHIYSSVHVSPKWLTSITQSLKNRADCVTVMLPALHTLLQFCLTDYGFNSFFLFFIFCFTNSLANILPLIRIDFVCNFFSSPFWKKNIYIYHVYCPICLKYASNTQLATISFLCGWTESGGVFFFVLLLFICPCRFWVLYTVLLNKL